MTPATKALLTAFADAHRREASAREAAATATREAARLRDALLYDLAASGIKLGVAIGMLGAAAGEPLDRAARKKLAARHRKRR